VLLIEEQDRTMALHLHEERYEAFSFDGMWNRVLLGKTSLGFCELDNLLRPRKDLHVCATQWTRRSLDELGVVFDEAAPNRLWIAWLKTDSAVSANPRNMDYY
jgi:hypothetical protein